MTESKAFELCSADNRQYYGFSQSSASMTDSKTLTLFRTPKSSTCQRQTLRLLHSQSSFLHCQRQTVWQWSELLPPEPTTDSTASFRATSSRANDRQHGVIISYRSSLTDSATLTTSHHPWCYPQCSQTSCANTHQV